MPALPSMFRGAEYRADTKVLEIRFQVGVYTYAEVPPDLGHAFVLAAAAGGEEPITLFNSKIEGKYKSRRLT